MMRQFLPIILASAAISGGTLPVQAENFTTSAEVKPILMATKSSWVAVRLYGEQDLLYFTNLLAWRCGVTQIDYAVNDGAMTPFEAEPCYLDQAQPNALKAESLDAILVPYAANSIENVAVRVTFDDATTETASFQRSEIQID
jgi:hypothetical protein